MTKSHFLIASLFFLPLFFGNLAQAQDRAPAVIELFTSQGCSSCPPADEFLGELSQRDDVIALAFHVDYWDYIGWKDPYASPKFTKRQHQYAATRGSRQVYTPQMILNGLQDYIGSRRRQVEKAIVRLEDEDRPLAVSMSLEGVDLPEAPHSGDPAAVFLVSYDARIETAVARGENAGRDLVDFNVVRSFTRIGQWDGSANSLAINSAQHKAEGRSGLVVLVQPPEGGRIYAAGHLLLD